MVHLLGYDVGSSSIKASLLDGRTGKEVASATSPERELEISAPRPGWAEQHPETWWAHLRKATSKIGRMAPDALKDTAAIGISYQMHGLVVVDGDFEVLRPSIIWCDSRAVEIGDRAAEGIGRERCLDRFLNFPGNFTASKLQWVHENEPELFRRIHKAMLPGDYVALRLTGEARTTPSGLSEGILWDYREQDLAAEVLEHYGIPEAVIPERVPTFSDQGTLSRRAAGELGLPEGVKVCYRAGDQPNNALSLKVLHPGEVAATAGTSGVVYGVADEPVRDARSRVNTFVHVNHRRSAPRYGVLLCINGTGISNSWMKNQVLTGTGLDYGAMNAAGAEAPVGSGGLVVLPFGNGAERTLENRDLGASVHGLNFNIHKREHLLRAVQEGIVFALRYGLEIMGEMGLKVQTVRAGAANLFLSPLFRSAFACATGALVELYNTDGAQGAARGAGLGSGVFGSEEEAFRGLEAVETVEPDPGQVPAYEEAYGLWKKRLLEAL